MQDIKETYLYEELNEDYINGIVDTTMEQITFMTKTIDDFKNFFSPSKEKVRFHVKTVIDELLSMFGQLFNRDYVEISVITAPDTIQQAEGYPNEFKQVILNMLNNAKDAITSKKESSGRTHGLIEIIINNNEAADKIITLIRDNGGGIPDHLIEKIFGPYFTTKGSKGTGIGLYMSKTIIETNMGGSLTVRNIDGGAEFMICLGVSGGNSGSI